jgi:uncharacterized protein (TIGR03067 family)
MKGRLAILAGSLALVFTAPLTGSDAKKDQERLQGTWVATKGQKKAEVQFTGDKFIVIMNDATYKGVFKIDPAKKPKTIDMTVKTSTNDKYTDMTSLGIYKLKGDQLTWCFKEPGRDDRPEEFVAREGDNLLLVLRKKKSAD